LGELERANEDWKPSKSFKNWKSSQTILIVAEMHRKMEGSDYYGRRKRDLWPEKCFMREAMVRKVRNDCVLCAPPLKWGVSEEKPG
jgi:hypothetical protein